MKIKKCTGCGTTATDWIEPLDQGYTACCNEPVDYVEGPGTYEALGTAECTGCGLVLQGHGVVAALTKHQTGRYADTMCRWAAKTGDA
jgi:hypothetical protein